MTKGIKILYYVDINDNTKNALMAFPSEKDLRNFDTIEKIGKTLYENNFGYVIGVCNSIAYELVYHGKSEVTCQMGNYEFGFDETELFE